MDGDGKVRSFETCAVCGESVAVAKAVPAVYQGKLYFTCSPSCKNRFVYNPSKYAKFPALSGIDLSDDPD